MSEVLPDWKSSVSLPSYKSAVETLSYGKRLPSAVYVFRDEGRALPDPLAKLIEGLCRELQISAEFNVLKFHTSALRISFLSYPEFFVDPHPVLQKSITVDLALGGVRRTEYRERSNPPILHRKETFLPPDHPDWARFSALTKAEEMAGLYDSAKTIGFHENWQRLLRSKGLTYREHELVRGEEREISGTDRQSVLEIGRHKTAIVRTGLSKPVKLLMETGLLGDRDSVFDYGCGLGSDVEGLKALGYQAGGWDPVHAPQEVKRQADVVNLGYVLNVIEDPAERVETLGAAWLLTKRVLAVTTLIAGQETYAYAETFADGVLTARNTFQKYFEQGELQSLIEHALEVEAIPVALGVFFVFRSLEDQQDFLASRTKRPIDWEQIHQKLRVLGTRTPRSTLYERHASLLDDFWDRMLELGRPPKKHEYGQFEEVRTACRSTNQAVALFLEKYGEEPLNEARQRRKEDLLIYLIAGEFKKRRPPFSTLSVSLRQDVRSFFGSYAAACDQSRSLLFRAGDPDELEDALQDLEFGWFDASEGHFTVHRSLLDRLPSVMRAYVECGTQVYGNPREADLIKLHLRSRKLTLLHYDDFEGKPLPELQMRIKIDLRTLFVNVFDHSASQSTQLLFFKERYVGTDHPKRVQYENYSKKLRKLGFTEANIGHGPSKERFGKFLATAGLTWSLNPKSRT